LVSGSQPSKPAALPPPPAPGLGHCLAVWQHSQVERRRQRTAVAGTYTTLAAVVAAVWRSPAAAALLLAAGAVHAAATGRTRLAAGQDWFATRRRWVRLDQLTRVTAAPGPAGTVLHLTDANRRRVSVAVADLARAPRLLELVANAVADAERRGALSLNPRTRACLHGPRPRRGRRGGPTPTADQEGRQP
jgi:hypothetical protein